MPSPPLDPRDREILCQAVHLYITSGEPVASRALSGVNAEGLSSATIRSVLAKLEERGYLEQPHPSAGRVPTDKGYRFYVGALAQTKGDDIRDLNPSSGTDLAVDERQRITELFASTTGDVGNLVQGTALLLADLSDTLGFVIGPDFQYSPLQRIDFVRLGPRRVLAVLVSQTEQVIHRVVELEQDLSGEDLAQCARYLEDEFRNFTLAEAREALLARMKTIKAIVNRLVRNALTVGVEAFSGDIATSEVRLNGTSRLLNKPEFLSNIERAQQLLATLEERKRLVDLLGACLDENELRVVIGSESRVPAFEGLSVIGAQFSAGEQTLGTIGIMGPTRMEYARFISLVDYTAWSLSEAISQAGSHLHN